MRPSQIESMLSVELLHHTSFITTILRLNRETSARRRNQSQIEGDKVIEAHVTHWQEFEKQDRVQQGQEISEQNSNLSKYADFIRVEDHNFRHEAEKQMSHNTMPTSSRHTVSRLAGV